MGKAEEKAAARVVRSGRLSGFFGSWGEDYTGGPKVREFERAWGKRFTVPHVISVNSATSGLMAAIGAVGVSPGDEVIVPPLTMSATAAAPLIYGGIPVFADVEAETGCLSVEVVQAAITPRTKAIIAVNLFGHPARLHQLRQIADRAGIFLIEDSAQAPLAEEYGQLAGTIGHIGVFSLNYHKHIHTGEGGMCVTSDRDLAVRLQLIRNHGENVVGAYGLPDAARLVGFNWRLTELQAAIGLVQLKKIDRRVGHVKRAARRLSRLLAEVPGLAVPAEREGCESAFYVWMARLDLALLAAPRAKISAALTAAGIPHLVGYVAPLYRLPLFKKWATSCPVAERLTRDEWLGLEMCAHDFTDTAIDQVAGAIKKVFSQYAKSHR